MKINKNLFTLLALVTLMAGSALMASAQIAGGYSAAAVTDKDVKEAAAFAVSNKNAHSQQSFKLVQILKAERQVVAGMNYMLCMSATEGGGTKAETYDAIVYVDLQKKMELSHWAKSDCAGIPSKPATPKPVPDKPANQKPIKVGGYKTVDPTDERAREAAEWAVRTQGEKDGTGIELMTLVKAEQQVVQGMNYRLCMRVNTEGADEPVSFVEAVIYRNLKKEFKLTSWKGGSTCGKGLE